MSDFLGAVARRAIGEPGGLRPAAPPWIPAAEQRGRGAATSRAVPRDDFLPAGGGSPDDGALDVPTRFIDARQEPVEPAIAPPAEARPGRKRRSRRAGNAPGTRHRSSRVAEDDPGPLDGGRAAAARPDEPMPIERPLPERPTPRRSGPPAAAEEGVAEASGLLPVVASAAALRRAAKPVRPDGTVRPMAAVDRPVDDYRRGDARRIDGDDQGPVVHVSIGRIEVRAPQPPPALPAPTPIGPGMTLDAYLRRRDQDVRR